MTNRRHAMMVVCVAALAASSITRAQPVVAPAGNAQALAVRDGVIVAVGTDAEIMAIPHPAAAITDLAGHTLMPGLYDMHVHVLDAGLAMTACHLPNYRAELPWPNYRDRCENP